MTANEQNVKRARKAVYQIVEANDTEYTKFITLTYKEPNFDYDKLAHDFKMMRRNLKRKGYDFPYLYVVEVHDSKKTQKDRRGSLHIHVVAFTDRFIPFEILSKAWPHGFVKINADYTKSEKKGGYVAKYITKDTMPPDRKAYRTSRNVKRPTETEGLTARAEVLGALGKEGYLLLSTTTHIISDLGKYCNVKTGEIETENPDNEIEYMHLKKSERI